LWERACPELDSGIKVRGSLRITLILAFSLYPFRIKDKPLKGEGTAFNMYFRN
jgi:hypothetical protein